jgi:hypothetical protein
MLELLAYPILPLLNPYSAIRIEFPALTLPVAEIRVYQQAVH